MTKMWRGIAEHWPWERKRKPNPNLINSVHLEDWLHNELAGTDEPQAEQVYYGVIGRVAEMRAWR